MNKIDKVLITQSNYIPWKGYFDSIAMVDCFVVYDDMQYTKRDWRNRNKIVTPNGLKWLSIPVEVKGKFFQKINETVIADKNWNKSHWSVIKQNYQKSAHFNEMKDWVEPLFLKCNYKYLTEINLHFIRGVMSFLNIDTSIKYSSEFNLNEDRTQRLVDISKSLGAKEYYSGPAAKNYMDESFFTKENISVNYFNYDNYKKYNQLSEEFEHGVTIFDLIFNEGNSASNFLKVNQ